MAITEEQVKAALQTYTDPATGKDYVAGKEARNVRIDGSDVYLEVVLGYPAKSVTEEIRRELTERVGKIAGVGKVSIDVQFKIVAHAVQRGLKLLGGVKNVIAVASGKGGVGKSTTAVNLALALAAEGANVGILDADIYGPSQQVMMGLSGKPMSPDGKTIEPMVNYGVQAMSIGLLIDVDTPMVWRGPMVTQALEQLLRDTQWKDLDDLVVDLPPGTGDIQLTLSQRVPVSGAIIVTTPQDIALADARKGLMMFRKVAVPVLGIIENMATHVCSNCGHEEHVFGAGGGERMASEYGVPLLGSLPLDLSIREQTDSGRPSVAAEPEGRIAKAYLDIARRAAGRLASGAATASFPTLSVSDD